MSLRLSPLAASALLAACTSPTQLYFADQTIVGVRIGSETEGLASASVGYKAQSVAIVPVSAVDSRGKLVTVGGSDGKRSDAPSTFAVFRADGAKDARVKLNQMFSTGIAAQMLTEGFECGMKTDANCSEPATRSAAASGPVAGTEPDAPASSRSEQPRQPALVYLRSDTWGFDLGAATKEQGISFTLGYSNSNVALVPVYGVNGNKDPEQLAAGHRNKADAYSVLGQFDSKTETRQFGFGLDRYFSTGVASQNLARGLRQQVAREAAAAASAASR